MSTELNVMENNELVEETVKTGAEIVTNVVKDHSALKNFGKATGVAVLAVLAYEVAVKPIVKGGKKKFHDWRDKRKASKSEGSDEKTEKTESSEN